ncbi:MAG: STAS domain-containing protein [Phycisphaerales bacterium]
MDVRHELAGHDRQILVVHLPPAVNHITAEPLRQAIEQRLPVRDDAALVLDASEVSLITSVGIAMLLQVQELCDDRAARMLLASLAPPVRKMLALLKLDARFRSADSLDEAVRDLDNA